VLIPKKPRKTKCPPEPSPSSTGHDEGIQEQPRKENNQTSNKNQAPFQMIHKTKDKTTERVVLVQPYRAMIWVTSLGFNFLPIIQTYNLSDL
jgi:hypothetical protein